MNSFTQSLAAKQRENTENQPKTREKSRKELLEEWKKETSEKRRFFLSLLILLRLKKDFQMEVL